MVNKDVYILYSVVFGGDVVFNDLLIANLLPKKSDNRSIFDAPMTKNVGAYFYWATLYTELQVVCQLREYSWSACVSVWLPGFDV